jgi:hypothetical protein
MDLNKRFIWKIGGASIEFSNGSMQYFNEYLPAKDYKDVCYFYYDLTIKMDKRSQTFRTHDFPKVQYLKDYCEHIIKHNTKENGYLLDDCSHGGFFRKISYHQTELLDWSLREYFMRIEKYHYEVKQQNEDTSQESIFYRLTVGEIPYKCNSKKEEAACMALYIHDLQEKDLVNLYTMGEEFIEETIQRNNHYLAEYLTSQEHAELNNED